MRRHRAAAPARLDEGGPGAEGAAESVGRKHTGTASTQQAFGRFFVDLTREAPDVAERVVTVSPDVGTSHQPRRLDQQGRHLEHRRPDRLVRRRHRHARALARARPRPPHRARDRRDEPRRAARRARRDVVARRPAAAAGRDDLRPVRRPRARAVVVRHLRRRPVDPGRHAERRDARPRGRSAPVGNHAEHRDRAARLRRLRARVRAGLRVVLPARARRGSASRAGRPPTSGSRRGRSTSRCTPARARRRSPAATSSSRTTRRRS